MAIEVLTCLMPIYSNAKKSLNSSRSEQAELLGAVGLRDSEKIRQRAEPSGISIYK
jgi:hypothetical protein